MTNHPHGNEIVLVEVSTNLILAQERCASVEEQVHRYGLTRDNRCFHPVNRN